MIGRLRQILPSWLMILFAALFLVFEGPVLYVEWRLGRPILDLRIRPGTVLINLAGAAYGMHRAVSFHPFYRGDFRKWLELTPWTVHKPLPLGPIDLVWEDGLVLGGLMLLCLTQPWHGSIRVLSLFLLAHSAMLCLPLWWTGAGTIGYLVVFGLGLAVRLWLQPWPCFAVAASVYLVCREGLWQSLAGFPWTLNWSALDLSKANMQVVAEKLAGPACGWPHDRLLRDVRIASRFRLHPLDAVLVSLLCGWLGFCLAGLVRDPQDRWGPPGIILEFLWILPLLRLSVYISYYRSPLGLWSRIRTGRWIIPGYDRCLVGPLLSVLAAPCVLLPCLAARVPGEICLPIAIFAVILVCLITPPGLREWRLTGQHRIVAGQYAGNQRTEFVKVG